MVVVITCVCCKYGKPNIFEAVVEFSAQEYEEAMFGPTSLVIRFFGQRKWYNGERPKFLRPFYKGKMA